MTGAPQSQKQSNLTVGEPSLHENDESPSQFVAAGHRMEYQKVMPNSMTSTAGFNISSSLTIHPLDYPALVTQENLDEKELNRTLKGLVQWLTIVETGFNSILDNAIEEEQELPLEDSNNVQLYPHAEHDAVVSSSNPTGPI